MRRRLWMLAAALGLSRWRTDDGFPMLALVGLEVLVVNRALSLLMDVPAVRFRNIASDAGFSLDGARLPLRLAGAPGREG